MVMTTLPGAVARLEVPHGISNWGEQLAAVYYRDNRAGFDGIPKHREIVPAEGGDQEDERSARAERTLMTWPSLPVRQFVPSPPAMTIVAIGVRMPLHYRHDRLPTN